MMEEEQKALYFLAVLTPDSLAEQIREFQDEFAKEYNSVRQLKIPIHITVIPPFNLDQSKETDLRESIDTFCNSRTPFRVELADFGEFDKSVVFVDVCPNENLQNLYQDLFAWINSDMELNLEKRYPKYNPHITLANRDLAPDMFESAWNTFKNRSFNGAFNANSLCLLKHDGERWEVLEEFILEKSTIPQ